jgi:hemerythrin-like domain-containing protein
VDTPTGITTRDPISGWHTEHGYFSRLLGLLQKQVDVFRTGERPNYELMLDIISYLRDYSDRYHHPREDVAYARLAARCPEMAPVLGCLVQEHRILANAGERLARLVNAALDEAIVERTEIEMAAGTYLVYYRAHIDWEEGHVLARAGEALTPEDWEAVNNAVPEGPDPLFGPEPDRRYRELRRQIALEA